MRLGASKVRAEMSVGHAGGDVTDGVGVDVVDVVETTEI
jgi:hypothetical protein